MKILKNKYFFRWQKIPMYRQMSTLNKQLSIDTAHHLHAVFHWLDWQYPPDKYVLWRILFNNWWVSNWWKILTEFSRVARYQNSWTFMDWGCGCKQNSSLLIPHVLMVNLQSQSLWSLFNYIPIYLGLYKHMCICWYKEITAWFNCI